MERSEGFLPIARRDARVLVLGSLPGQRSLSDQEYYAHPQNAFWSIINDIFAISGDYEERCHGLIENKIALWDVLQASERPGSLDSDIRLESAVANDFELFFENHPRVDWIAFNGKKAEQLFRRFVPAVVVGHRQLISLPSTSPAFAAMPISGKLEKWKTGLNEVRSAD